MVINVADQRAACLAHRDGQAVRLRHFSMHVVIARRRAASETGTQATIEHGTASALPRRAKARCPRGRLRAGEGSAFGSAKWNNLAGLVNIKFERWWVGGITTLALRQSSWSFAISGERRGINGQTTAIALSVITLFHPASPYGNARLQATAFRHGRSCAGWRVKRSPLSVWVASDQNEHQRCRPIARRMKTPEGSVDDKNAGRPDLY